MRHLTLTGYRWLTIALCPVLLMWDTWRALKQPIYRAHRHERWAINLPSPLSTPVTHERGYLEIDFSTSPPSYYGAATSFWWVSENSPCGSDLDGAIWTGGAWFSGSGSVTSGGNEIEGTWIGGGQTYTFHFTRD